MSRKPKTNAQLAEKLQKIAEKFYYAFIQHKDMSEPLLFAELEQDDRDEIMAIVLNAMLFLDVIQRKEVIEEFMSPKN